jgi:prolyl oligopeptidase
MRLFGMMMAAGVSLSLAAGAMAQESDPYIWLEDVEGDRAMEWVEARNALTVDRLSSHPVYQPIFDRALEILDSDDRIAFPSILGGQLYNFWQDSGNPRGIWRRTSWDSYLTGEPVWETVLDIDALASDEGVPWAYGEATCLPPDRRRCLVRLSRGGADAVEVREFDMDTRQFMGDGFFLPEAKQTVAWVDGDALLVATDFGEGSMTTSGYARIARLWQRGTPLSQAETLFTASTSDTGVWVGTYETADGIYNVVNHRPNFYEGTTHVLRDGALVAIDVPLDADTYLLRDQLLVYNRSAWEVGGRTHEAASLLHIGMDEFLDGGRDFRLVLRPGERQTISSVRTTRDHLLVGMLDNVQSELRRYSYRNGEWSYERVPAPEMGSIGVRATSPTTNRYFFSYSGYTQPTTLYLAETDGSVCEVRRMPEMFDVSGLVVEQHEATSPDGTRIPYFIIHREDLPLNGDNPTLLHAYGGFEVSLTPGYSSLVGASWLERGGVYVVANLIRRGITSPSRLGISGGSNGGLLTGVAMTQRPDLYNAVVINVPLLDMQRYNKLLAGASWMAEYGSPDIPEEWEFIREYSPYHNVGADAEYPVALFTTTTRDDRVHPGHARKMAALMEDMGHELYYFENTEGGHGAGVTSEQRARMHALTYTYLWERLGQ